MIILTGKIIWLDDGFKQLGIYYYNDIFRNFLRYKTIDRKNKRMVQTCFNKTFVTWHLHVFIETDFLIGKYVINHTAFVCFFMNDAHKRKYFIGCLTL